MGKYSAIELTRKYAEIQYFPVYGWFQIDEEPDGICLPIEMGSALGKFEMEEVEEIQADLDRFYQIAKNI